MENINVKAVTKIVGINENTLRAWERRYGAVTPLRDDSGRRLYSSKDIERLKCLAALVESGHAIGKVAGIPTARLKKLVEETQGATQPLLMPPPPVSAGEEALPELLAGILNPLEKFDLEALNQGLQRARFELSPREVVLELFLPLMRKVGQRVDEGRISIFQEHILSSLLRDHLGMIYQSLNPYDFSSRRGRPSVALTTREGDMHEFGILLSGILASLLRWRTHYLGPNMPAQELAGACSKFKIDVLVLGLSAIPAEVELVSPESYLAELDEILPAKVALCIGGSHYFEEPPLRSRRKLVRIDSLSNLEDCLERAL